MKSTSGRFSALIIFDETIAAIQQRCDNKPVVPLVNNGTILPRKAPFWTFCRDLPGVPSPLQSEFSYYSQRVSRLTSYEVSLFFHGCMGIDRVEGYGVSEQQLFKRLFY